MKVIFFPAGPIEWGSARMRSWWVAKHMGSQAMMYDEGMEYPSAHAYIFQKIFDIPMAKEARSKGAKVFWDVCDPTWWWQPDKCKEITQNIDGVVASSEELAEDFREWSGMPCTTIPDRLDFDHFPLQREHQDINPVRLIWYGVAYNRITLFAALANLERLSANGHKIELTIFDDHPEQRLQLSGMFPTYQIGWNLEQENRVLASHDIALLPQYPGPWGRVKSNNKELTAYACGLPVSDGEYYDEMLELVSNAEKRQERADWFGNLIRDAYSVDKSAREWEALLK